MNDTVDNYSGSHMKRRDFLAVTAASLATLPIHSNPAFAEERERWPGLHDAIIINALGGISNFNPQLEAWKKDGKAEPTAPLIKRQHLNPRALQDALASGTTAINTTLGYVSGPADPFEFSVQSIAGWNATIRNHADRLLKVREANDIQRAKDENKIGIIFGFQNAAMMGDDAERVDVFANLGVKIIQLTYNIRNQLGDGSMVPDDRGLTEFGHAVMQRLHHNKVLIDLSHSSRQTCLDAIEAAQGPIAMTHTGCRVLADLPRNKTDAELKGIADTGGVVGIYFMEFLNTEVPPSAQDVVRHIEHAVNVCGEDHVGIGTDGGTTQVDDLDGYRQFHHVQYERRKELGIAATGEKPDSTPFIPDLQGPTQFQKLADLLHARGHASDRIEKILGRNFQRLMTDVWGA